MMTIKDTYLITWANSPGFFKVPTTPCLIPFPTSCTPSRRSQWWSWWCSRWEWWQSWWVGGSPWLWWCQRALYLEHLFWLLVVRNCTMFNITNLKNVFSPQNTLACYPFSTFLPFFGKSPASFVTGRYSGQTSDFSSQKPEETKSFVFRLWAKQLSAKGVVKSKSTTALWLLWRWRHWSI